MDQSIGSFFTGVDSEYDQLAGLPNMTGTPERRLLLAILERAILDFVGNDRRELEQAESWLFATERHPGNDQFSFEWVCEQLDLDPQIVAAKVKAMPRRGTRKVAPWYFNKTTAVAA